MSISKFRELLGTRGSTGSQVPQNKYAELLAIIEELGKEIRPTYAGSKSAMERLKRDDSISEDVSSSGALSHCHVSAEGDAGKESETSLVSSEGTSASGLAVPEDRHLASQTAGGTVESRPMAITPACNKIRSLCLRTEEAFGQGKNLPFINPSSLETLRALVQEIQSSGETDPEIWKDCEGRWLHLFQLVEKQYQEQILAQQEQYQCQIQLIQDEIKALVQLQNRQASVHPHTEFSPTSVTKTTTDTKDYIFPFISSDCTVPQNVPSDNDSLVAPAHTPFSSYSPPPHRSETTNQREERATTVLSSGYGTLSAWETCLEHAGSPGDDEDGSQAREKHHWSSNFQEATETTVIGCQQNFSDARPLGVEELDPLVYQQRASGTSQPLTSWAQRHKHRPKKSKAGQASSQIPEYQELARGPKEPHRQKPLDSADSQDQHRPAGPSTFPLRRSDSLMSEASGLTYWRLNESELYCPLPHNFDSDAFLLLQEASISLTPPPDPGLTLREIYRHKQRTDCKRSDWEGSDRSSPSSPQVLTLDPALNMRQSDRTSGFTSPSHFSSPSFATQPHLNPRAGTPVTPDSMVECSPNPGDTDCISDASSVSYAGPSPSKVQRLWGNTSQAVLFPSQDKTQPCFHVANQQRMASAPLASEEEGSHTHTSTLKPCSASGANLRPADMERASSLEDPVVLSLLRQNLREKHARHVADLKAYYESEIQILRDKLKLRDLPRDLEKINQALTERCKHLAETLAEATSRFQELEATNGSLEKKLAEWPERYAVAVATVKSLQQRLEESKRSGKEKDALAARLKTHIRQLKKAVQEAYRESDEKEARRATEYNMLQELSRKNDFLLKEHEEVKNNLLLLQNKLDDANHQISELRRCASPPECEQPLPQTRHLEQSQWETGRIQNSCALTPMMRALIELEETRATESRAPSKRETLLLPRSARSSPKRCPTENYSTAFGHMLPREELLVNRFNGHVDQRRHSFHSSSPRRRLQFTSTERKDDLRQPDSCGSVNPPDGNSQLGWKEQGACGGSDLPDTCKDSALLLLDKLSSLAEAEKLFDELTQEKLQIEAALSRMPGAGGRVTLQTRLDENKGFIYNIKLIILLGTPSPYLSYPLPDKTDNGINGNSTLVSPFCHVQDILVELLFDLRSDVLSSDVTANLEFIIIILISRQ
ncbi:hypothetical protein F2P81_002620 [Scophthalmus maximus]|uniref:M-phase phosphoprotein 9 n=1 Tax=Scophthalmus maximus TaxID=52904 RepID=A0A6A4TTR7_SCOMX|nr:hypothetical protein F2P81_002620 [Scophthalmus maximus]